MSNNFHLQLYRGTTAQNDAYTGLSGEVTVDTTLSKLRLHDGSTAGGVEIGGMPVGSIIPYAGTTIPAGYLLCDGSAISRTTYSALFAAIGTTYGAGDGNSTFNIPNETAGTGITPGYTQFNITPFNRYETVNYSLENDFICQNGGWYLISNMKDTSNASGEIYLNGIAIDTVQTSGQWERSDRLIILKKNDIISANNVSKQYSVIQGYYKLTGNVFELLIKYR